ncbi:MAG: hypothetical protein AAGA30_18810 [Planctomycetota bacterium]
MLLRNLGQSDPTGNSLHLEMAEGLPTIAAFARLCGKAIAGDVVGVEPSQESLALVASAKTGMFDIRGDKDAFESADRFLSVCVEVGPDQRLLFRDKNNPRKTLIFLDAFQQLCRSGFIMHHMLRDFSLSKSGFELADSLQVEDYRELIDFAVEVEH